MNKSTAPPLQNSIQCAIIIVVTSKKRLIAEQRSTETFIYHYTSGGSIIGMSYRSASDAAGVFETYVFEKNISGDVVAVYNLSGTKLVSYKYDAWGNFTTTYHNGTTSSSVAARNPFKYRGYYYDSDLGLYYLQTRYYDSVTGRFINADGYVSTGQGMLGNNMFAYCNNNPVMFTDPAGEFPGWAIALIVCVVVAAAVEVGKDIYHIANSAGETTEEEADGNLGYEVSENGKSVQIHNSHKITSPITQFGYSIYLNHFNDSTKDVINGSTAGATSEWLTHNVGYAISSIIPMPKIKASSEHLNIGNTVYDNKGYVAGASVAVNVVGCLLLGDVLGAIVYPIADAIIYNHNK